MVIDFSSLYEMPKSIEQMFESLARGSKTGYSRNITGAMNIIEDDKKYYVDILVPSIDPESIDLTISDKNMIVRGEVCRLQGRYFRQERESGSFQRVVALNTPVDRNTVEAKCENGILSVVLKKSEEVKHKKITIS